MLERIIITLNEDGTFRGASSQDFAGIPVPISEAGLGTVGEAIGATALAEIERLNTAAKEASDAALATSAEVTKDMSAQIADLSDFKTRAMGLIGGIASAIQSEQPPEEIVALVAQSIQSGLAPENVRKDAEINKQIASLLASKSTP